MRFISFGVLKSVLLAMFLFGDSTTDRALAVLAFVVAMIAETVSAARVVVVAGDTEMVVFDAAPGSPHVRVRHTSRWLHRRRRIHAVGDAIAFDRSVLASLSSTAHSSQRHGRAVVVDDGDLPRSSEQQPCTRDLQERGGSTATGPRETGSGSTGMVPRPPRRERAGRCRNDEHDDRNCVHVPRRDVEHLPPPQLVALILACSPRCTTLLAPCPPSASKSTSRIRAVQPAEPRPAEKRRRQSDSTRARYRSRSVRM